MNLAGTLEKVTGPVRGHFIALYACPMGELGRHYLGYYKICPKAPSGFLDAQCIDQGSAGDIAGSACLALLAAEASAIVRIGELFPLAHELAGDRLLSILYLSSATRQLRSRELAPALPASRIRTSVLAHNAGNFMHYLEGPPLAVEHMMERIRRDSGHGGLTELVRRPIAHREFPHWPFKYLCAELHDRPGGPWGEEVFAPGDTLVTPEPSPARALLIDFWARALGDDATR